MLKISQSRFVRQLLKWRVELKVLWKKLYKFRDITKSNFELGKKHYGLGNFDDAVLRFQFVTWLDSSHASGWYWLGLSQLAKGKEPEAIAALKKAISLKPDFQEAREALENASKNV